MWFVALALVVAYVAAVRQRTTISYETFVLTLPTSQKRFARFMENHPPTVPLHVVYGKDTKKGRRGARIRGLRTPRKNGATRSPCTTTHN